MNNIKQKSKTKENIRYEETEYEENKQTIHTQNKPQKKTRFDYLYENSKIIQEKKKIKEKEKQINDLKRMKPTITKMAKDITRDTNLFHKRLFPKANFTLEQEEDSLTEKDLYSQNSFQNEQLKQLYNRKNKDIESVSFTFHPQINKNSENIADKLPLTSKDRLILPLKSKEKLIPIKHNIKSLNTKIPKEKTGTTMEANKNVAKVYKVNKRSISLYNQGIQLIKKKEELVKRAKEAKAKYYSEFTYKPKLNLTYSKSTPLFMHDDLYTRNEKWKENISFKKQKIKKKSMINEKNHCTFSPKINNGIMTNSKFPLINNNNLVQYISFVNKKKQLLKQKNSTNYKTVATPKVVRQYVNEDINSSMSPNRKFIKKWSDRNNKSIQKERNKLGLEEFFYSSNSNTKDDYFSHSMGNPNIVSLSRGKSVSSNSIIKTHEHTIAFNKAVKKMFSNFE